MFNFNTVPSVGYMAIMGNCLMGFASAHMYIAEPKPIAGNAVKDPLDPSGSNFPCHGATLPSTGGQKISAGSSFDFQLELGGGANTAVHGGGSCQLSITYETDPVKVKDPSNWHVIYSIEGGCPSNTKANLDTAGDYTAKPCTSDDQGDCVHSWDVPMPMGVNSGNAVLAWSWQNTLGNREFYMGCSAISIDGGSGEEMDSLPSLFVANLAIEGGKCPTTQSVDVLYPNPGRYVTTMSAKTSGTVGHNWPKATPTGEGCGGSDKPLPQPTGYDSVISQTETTSPSSAYVQQSNYGYPSQATPTSIIASYGNQQGSQTQTTFATTASVAALSSSVTSASALAFTEPPSGYSASGKNKTSSGCIPGSFGCSGPYKFGIFQDDCSIAYQDVSVGMQCSEGQVVSKRRFRRHSKNVHKH